MKYTYCLICKTTSNLTRHHVIPTSITKQISNYTYKSEDIVCLCNSCHRKYHQSLDSTLPTLMNKLGINISEVYKEVRGKDSEKTRRKITALTKVGLPEQVRLDYIKDITEVFSDFDVTRLDYFVSLCVATRVKFSNEKYIADNVNINTLQSIYREHFNQFVNKRT